MSFDGLDELYQDTILDHYKNPRGRHTLKHIDAENHGYNPICGDIVIIRTSFKNGRIEDIAVESTGCAISVASGSILAELLPGKNLEEVQQITESFRDMMHGKGIPEGLEIGDLDVLEGVHKFQSRIKCALLAWVTLKDLIKSWLSNETSESPSTTENEE